MRISLSYPKTTLALILIFIVLTALFIFKPKRTFTPVTETASSTHYLAEAEKQREDELDEKAKADKLEKLTIAKRSSVECKFWTQQQLTDKSSKKIKDKITQFCELEAVKSAGDTTL